jgi:hypothetical protein
VVAECWVSDPLDNPITSVLHYSDLGIYVAMNYPIDISTGVEIPSLVYSDDVSMEYLSEASARQSLFSIR